MTAPLPEPDESEAARPGPDARADSSPVLGRALGALFLTAGLGANPWALEGFLWHGAAFRPWALVLIGAADLFLVGLGACLLWRAPAWARKTALFLASLGLCLAAAEVLSFATGFFTPAYYRDRHRMFYEMQQPDDRLGFRNRPDLRDFHLSWSAAGVEGAYDTDEKGFRNPPGTLARADCWVAGDSFAFGEWVEREKTFFGLWQERWGESVASLGVSGYDLVQYDRVVRRALEERAPDTLYLCLFANDLRPERDDAYFRDFYERSGRTKYAASSLYMRSFTLQLLRLGKNLLTEVPGSARTGQGLWLYDAKGGHPGYFDEGHHRAVEDRLAALLGHLRDRGVRTVVVLVPSKESACKEDFLRLFPGRSLAVEEKAYRRFARIARDRGADCVDLTHAFRERAAREVLYFARDPHWNENGHRLAADAADRGP